MDGRMDRGFLLGCCPGFLVGLVGLGTWALGHLTIRKNGKEVGLYGSRLICIGGSGA